MHKIIISIASGIMLILIVTNSLHADNNQTQEKFITGVTETKTIQFGLIALGYLKGNIDGIWDGRSEDALTNYLNQKTSKILFANDLELIELIIKDISTLNSSDLKFNILNLLDWPKNSKQEIKDTLVNDQSISISDFKKTGMNNVYLAIDKEIIIDKNTKFGRNDKVFIIDSFIKSASIYRNQYEVRFGGRSFVNIINSTSDSNRSMEAFLFTYSDKASALQLNFKHNLGDPWQVAKNHKGHLDFIDSTCNITLTQNSKTGLICTRANKVMIEPLLPKGRYQVSLPSNEKVKEWKSHKSLPWLIEIKESFIEHIDLGISPGIDLTVLDTLGYRGGIAMCCSGYGKIDGLKVNKLYKNRTWSVSSDQGRAKLTLKNSSSGGIWPTAWGEYRFQINNSDMIDPMLGSSASMKIENSTLEMIRAQEQARVIIKDSILVNSDNTQKKISALDASIIRIKNLKGLKQQHIYEKGGRVILEK